LNVPGDATRRGGLCLYGAEAGAYPVDPTLLLNTESALPSNLGVDVDAPITVDTAAARSSWLLPPGDSGDAQRATWTYTTKEPGAGWTEAAFDDKGWERGQGGFGTEGTPAIRVGTAWNTPAIWLRAPVDLPALGANDQLSLHLFHDEDVEIFVNGKPLYRHRGYISEYDDIYLDGAQRALFKPGRNLLAISCRQTGGGQGIDLGLKLQKGD